MQDSKTVAPEGAAGQAKSDAHTFSADDSINQNSRIALLEQLESFGFAVDQYSECTIEQLQDLVKGAKWLQRTYENTPNSTDENGNSAQSRSIEGKKDGKFYFSEVDKKVLKSLLGSSGRVSSLALSRKLDIPLTTVQRRRKRLETEFLDVSYSLRLDKLGWRTADLLVSTQRGTTSTVGKDLLSHSSITRVCKAIGEHTIDLLAVSVFRDNKELLKVIEWIKSLDGVKDVVWTEPIEVVGLNSSMQYEIIDKHL